jgi:uncharacterized membrane protein YhhN
VRAGAFPLVALVLASVVAGMLWYLWEALDSWLNAPVTLYVIIIELMTALAISRFLHDPSTPTLLAAVGAVLFMCSDAALAINRFRKAFHQAELWVLASYFTAQLLIALAV